MKAIIVGLGSMGKRRLRLLKKLRNDVEIIGVDSNLERIKEVEMEYGICCEQSIEKALSHKEICCAFVCTSPLSHNQIIRILLENNLNVFTEINLVDDGYNELIELAKVRNKVLFLSSTFMYRKDIKKISEMVLEKRVNYIYHTGQYLPDWHPWENYKDFFVADMRTNGCREIMAIEFPWLIKCFGNIKKVFVVADDKLSKLELGYRDNYLITIEHENGNKGIVAIDVVSRKARRNLEIYNDDVHILWDGTPQSLQVYDCKEKCLKEIRTYESVDKDSRYTDNIIENAYGDEIDAFLYEVETGKKDKSMYSFEKDLFVLKWIDNIEYGE